MSAQPLALGLDFGTDSVRAVLLGADGHSHGAAVAAYRHGQLVTHLPAPHDHVALPGTTWALQHPGDWLDAARDAIAEALGLAGRAADAIRGIGVDFTSCTVLPTTADGTPLCLLPGLANRPHAWPKLWKHHGAITQTDDLNRVARERGAPWLARYGGTVGLEWLWPKLLEVFDDDRELFDSMAVWVEAGDWFVWQLTGGPAHALVRSSCQAGYKGCWSPASGGYPEAALLDAVRPGFSAGLERLPGRHLAPGQPAGNVSPEAAQRLGLREGTPVATAIIDAHAAVPGVGAGQPGTLVMVLGTSACHMLNARIAAPVPGVAGVVEDGILPGLVGYEMGQAAVGDAFAWLARLTGRPLDALASEAATLGAPGAQAPLVLDWLNGCRTPLMDGTLRGAMTGLTLHTTPAELYRAIAEGTALGCRWIVELLAQHQVPVEHVVACGGLPHRAPVLVQLIADVLDTPVTVHPARHASARGAAMLGALAAGHAGSVAELIEAMATTRTEPRRFTPRPGMRALLDARYAAWRALADHVAG